MSDFIDKIKEKAEGVSALIDNELTVLEGVGGDDIFAHNDDDKTAESADDAE